MIGALPVMPQDDPPNNGIATARHPDSVPSGQDRRASPAVAPIVH